MIYFVTAREIGRVKIGYSENPRARFSQLKTSSPIPLVLEKVCQGTVADEGDLHRNFSEFRIVGEWFTLGDAIESHMNLIEEWPKSPARRREFIFDEFDFNAWPDAPTTLRELLKHSGITQAEFARRCEYDRGNMNRVLQGASIPSLPLAVRIERETSGHVVAADWVSDRPTQTAA